MRTWARMLLRDAPAEGFNLEELRRRAQVDAAKDYYHTLEPAHLDTNRVTAGVAYMYMLQLMLYSGQYHTEDLVRGHSYLYGTVEG